MTGPDSLDERSLAELEVRDLDLAVTLLVVAEVGSFKDAGAKLGISGQAVRNRIARLEQNLRERFGEQIALLDDERGFRPTEAAKRLAAACSPQVRAYAASWNDACASILGGRRRVAITGFARVHLLPLLDERQAEQIEWVRCRPSEVAALVKAGRAELGLGPWPRSHEVPGRLDVRSRPDFPLFICWHKERELQDVVEEHGWLLPDDEEELDRQVLAGLSGSDEPRVARHQPVSRFEAFNFAARGEGAVLGTLLDLEYHRDKLREERVETGVRYGHRTLIVGQATRQADLVDHLTTALERLAVVAQVPSVDESTAEETIEASGQAVGLLTASTMTFRAQSSGVSDSAPEQTDTPLIRAQPRGRSKKIRFVISRPARQARLLVGNREVATRSPWLPSQPIEVDKHLVVANPDEDWFRWTYVPGLEWKLLWTSE